MAFLMENLEDSDNERICKNDLRKRYKDFCKKFGLQSKSDVSIKIALQQAFGVSEDRYEVNGNWEWFWIGVKWK